MHLRASLECDRAGRVRSLCRVEVAIAVLTRDLRIRDNAVLVAATREARRVVPLFVLDDAIGARVTPESHRYGFLCECLEDLDVSLRARGASLVVREGDWVAEVMRVVHETGTETVHVARDVSTRCLGPHLPGVHAVPSALARDAVATAGTRPGSVRVAVGGGFGAATSRLPTPTLARR